MHSNLALFNRTALWFGGCLSICVAVAGCSDPAPSGQILARVSGEDVTVQEFEHERGRMPDVPVSQIDNSSLETMVRRRALAQLARRRDLEQDPQYHFELRRTREELLVDALYRQLENDIQKPTQQDIADYIAGHPWQFSQRRIVALSSTDETDRAGLTIDTAHYNVRPPFPVMEIASGRSMLWQGKVHNVDQVREAPLEAETARVWASDRLMSAAVEKEVTKLLRQMLESGQLQYAPGYGPSGAQGRQRN